MEAPVGGRQLYSREVVHLPISADPVELAFHSSNNNQHYI